MPHYLVHTVEDADRLGVWGKVNPPFRQDEDIKRLWEGLATGIVRSMGTDSCSYAQKDKEANLGQFGDVWKAMPGISGGMQHWLPVMMTEGFHTGRLGIEQGKGVTMNVTGTGTTTVVHNAGVDTKRRPGTIKPKSHLWMGASEFRAVFLELLSLLLTWARS